MRLNADPFDTWTNNVNNWMDKNRHKQTEKYWVRKFRDYMDGDIIDESFLQDYVVLLENYPVIVNADEVQPKDTLYYWNDKIICFKSFRKVNPEFLETTGGEPTNYSGSKLCVGCGDVNCDKRLERQNRMRAKLDAIRLKRIEDEKNCKKETEKANRNKKKRIRKKKREKEKKEDLFVARFNQRLNNRIVPTQGRLQLNPNLMSLIIAKLQN